MIACLLAFALGAAAVPPGESSYLPPNLYLVRATTVKVWQEPKERYKRGQLKVIAVLSGPARLLDQKFEASTREHIMSYRTTGSKMVSPENPAPAPPVNIGIWYLETGAEGLWWVSEDSQSQMLVPELRKEIVNRYRLNGFPYQKQKIGEKRVGTKGKESLEKEWKEGDVWAEAVAAIYAEKEWKEGEAWAEAVAAISFAKTDTDRRLLLERYAVTERSPIAAWAIGCLGRGGSAEPTARFLRGLVKNDKLSPRSQLALDEVLCRLEPKEWVSSADRRGMLDRWLSGKVDDTEMFGWGCKRLQTAVESQELDAKVFAAVVGPVTKRESLKGAGDFTLCQLLSKVRFGPKDQEAGVAFLDDVKVTATLFDVRFAANAGSKLNAPSPRP